MKQKVMLSIQGRQTYQDQEPDLIELVTEGTMEFRDGGWDICYKESDNSGRRTHDSVLAQDLYYQLTQEGFKVFFARHKQG